MDILKNEYNNRRVSDSDYLLFNKSFDKSLNIYSQAYLERSSSIAKIADFSKKDDEFGVSFLISGEISGKIYCLVKIHEKELHSKRTVEFQSLFIESMNILLGNFFTTLEKESGMMCMISSPKILKMNDRLTISNDKIIGSAYHFLTKYNLHYSNSKSQCRVFLLASNQTMRFV